MANVLNDEKKQQIMALGRQGWSLRKIQETTRVRRETISAYLRGVGEAQSGKYRRTRLFVLTLGHSRRAVRVLTFRSSTTTAAGWNPDWGRLRHGEAKGPASHARSRVIRRIPALENMCYAAGLFRVPIEEANVCHSLDSRALR